MPRASDYLSFFSSSSSLSSHPFLGRLLSFGASSSSSSSSSASPPPELALETPQPPTATAAMDIESGAPSPAPAIPGGRREDAADARRVAKLVQPVALAAAAGSLVLFVNAPAAAAGSLVPFVNAPAAAADGHSPELHSAYLALVCLGLFTSLGLSMHAVVSSGDPVAVAPLHKRLLLLAITFVLCAAVVRFLLVVSGVAPLHYVLAFLLLGALASILFLRLAGNIAQGEHTTGRARA